MQKVEGSNPFSRFAEGPHLRVFLVLPAGWTFCVPMDSIRTQPVAAPGSSARMARFAGKSWATELSRPSDGIQKVLGSNPASRFASAQGDPHVAPPAVLEDKRPSPLAA
jgi:hypothetical protein